MCLLIYGIFVRYQDLALDELIGTNLFAKLGPLVGIVDGSIDSATGDTKSSGGTTDARVVQLEHAYLKTLTNFTEDGVFLDPRLIKRNFTGWSAVQSQLGLDGGSDDALIILEVNDKAGHPLIFFGLVGKSIHQTPITNLSVGDPHLLASNFPMVPTIDSGSSHTGDVGA